MCSPHSVTELYYVFFDSEIMFRVADAQVFGSCMLSSADACLDVTL